jgi:dolichol-phosphate mannosyltransferase
MNSDGDSHTQPQQADGPQVLVAVCTYNEMSNIKALVHRIFAALPNADLLIVDDDSPDGTGKWAEQQAAQDPRIHVIIRQHQRGLGGATRRAFEYAVEQGYEFLLNLDGDLSHEPESLPALLTIARNQKQIDVVVGSRYCPGGSVQGWPLRRKIMSRMVNRFAVACLRLPVSDCSGSLRCYRVSALAAIDPSSLRSNGYAILEEVLIKLRSNGAEMTEIPITFNDRQAGDSKLTLSEAFRSASQLVRMAFAKR